MLYSRSLCHGQKKMWGPGGIPNTNLMTTTMMGMRAGRGYPQQQCAAGGRFTTPLRTTTITGRSLNTGAYVKPSFPVGAKEPLALSSSSSTRASSSSSSSSVPTASSSTSAHSSLTSRVLPNRPFQNRHVSSTSVPGSPNSAIRPLTPAAIADICPPLSGDAERTGQLEQKVAKKKRFIPDSLLADWKAIFKKQFWREDLMASLSVTMVAIPLNLAIALGSGVPPEVGIITGVVAGATAAAFGGSTLAITGPAAAMSMLVANVVRDHGLPGLAVVTFCAGALQLATGALKMGGVVKLTPAPVMTGFMTGIGALIMSSQLPRAMGVQSLNMDTIWHNMQHLFSAESAIDLVKIADQTGNLISLPSLGLAALTVAITMGINRTKLATKLPAVMVAVVATSALHAVLQLPGVAMIAPLPAIFPSVNMPDFPSLSESAHIAAASVLFFGVGSLESLLSCGAVDKLAKSRRAFDPNQELIGQGTANLACGMLGGMPATSVIARSSLSVLAGGKTRRVALAMSGWMLISMALFADVFQHIPVPTLAGVLLAVGTRMIDFHELKQIWTMRKAEALLPVGVTVAGMLSADLVVGVGMGMATSLALNMWHRGGSVPRPSLNYSIANDEKVEAGKKLIRVSLGGQVDFMAGMRIQKMQMELDEALTADMEDVECYGENNESLAAQVMSPVAIEVDMKGAAIADVSGALLLGELVSGLQRGGHMVKVINVLPECQDLLLKSHVPAEAILGLSSANDDNNNTNGATPLSLTASR